MAVSSALLLLVLAGTMVAAWDTLAMTSDKI